MRPFLLPIFFYAGQVRRDTGPGRLHPAVSQSPESAKARLWCLSVKDMCCPVRARPCFLQTSRCRDPDVMNAAASIAEKQI